MLTKRQQNGYINISELARFIGSDKTNVHRWVRRGLIPAPMHQVEGSTRLYYLHPVETKGLIEWGQERTRMIAALKA